MIPIAKALSVRAPWWWFILHAGKDIENRDWSSGFRGTVYLHASKWWKEGEVCGDYKEARCMEMGMPGYDSRQVNVVAMARMRAAGGCIVGRVDIVGCVASSASPWFCGKFGFVLANPVEFKVPVPCKGALGFFTVPDDVLAKLAEVQA